MKLRLMGGVYCDDSDWTVAVTTGYWFWKRTSLYIGRHTVWHRVDDGQMAGTLLSSELNAFFWKKERYLAIAKRYAS